MESLLLIVAIFFVATIVVAWLMLFPTGRDVISGSATTAGARVCGFAGNWLRSIAGFFGGGYTRLWRALAATAEFVAHNRRLMFGMALLLCLPPLVVTQFDFDLGLDGVSFESGGVGEPGAIDQDMISRLLRGEQLAPPPPLVPAMFETREVKLIRPSLPQANRDWSLLKPEFRQRLLVVYKVMQKKYGYNMVMIEGYRSPKRQRLLAVKRPGVTNAGAFESYHQFGLAADSAFLRNGELVISARSGWAMRGYRLYGRVAEAVGLTWGGDWQINDLGHVELQRPGVLH